MARQVSPSPLLRHDDPNAALRLIPGAYERNTLTSRQPGSSGGAAYGTDGLANGAGTLSPVTIAERQKEGGGGASQRPHPSVT